MSITFYVVKTKQVYVYDFERELTFADIYGTIIQRLNLHGKKLYFFYNRRLMENNERLPQNGTVYICIEPVQQEVFPYQQQLEILNSMGFHQENIKNLLILHHGDLDAIIELLCEN